MGTDGHMPICPFSFNMILTICAAIVYIIIAECYDNYEILITGRDVVIRQAQKITELPYFVGWIRPSVVSRVPSRSRV